MVRQKVPREAEFTLGLTAASAMSSPNSMRAIPSLERTRMIIPACVIPPAPRISLEVGGGYG